MINMAFHQTIVVRFYYLAASIEFPSPCFPKIQIRRRLPDERNKILATEQT
jgi:hypothetical protein